MWTTGVPWVLTHCQIFTYIHHTSKNAHDQNVATRLGSIERSGTRLNPLNIYHSLLKRICCYSPFSDTPIYHVSGHISQYHPILLGVQPFIITFCWIQKNPLVNIQKANWKIAMELRTVNQLFLWIQWAIFNSYVSMFTRPGIESICLSTYPGFSRGKKNLAPPGIFRERTLPNFCEISRRPGHGVSVERTVVSAAHSPQYLVYIYILCIIWSILWFGLWVCMYIFFPMYIRTGQQASEGSVKLFDAWSPNKHDWCWNLVWGHEMQVSSCLFTGLLEPIPGQW